MEYTQKYLGTVMIHQWYSNETELYLEKILIFLVLVLIMKQGTGISYFLFSFRQFWVFLFCRLRILQFLIITKIELNVPAGANFYFSI